VSDDQTNDVVEATDEAWEDERKVKGVAASLAAALRSGNAQASESAMEQYEALGLDEEDLDVSLGPIKRVLSPADAAQNAEVGQGTEDDIEAAAVNASDDTPATTTIGTHFASVPQNAQPLGEGDGEPDDDPDADQDES